MFNKFSDFLFLTFGFGTWRLCLSVVKPLSKYKSNLPKYTNRYNNQNHHATSFYKKDPFYSHGKNLNGEVHGLSQDKPGNKKKLLLNDILQMNAVML